jgi:hypothetical protein
MLCLHFSRAILDALRRQSKARAGCVLLTFSSVFVMSVCLAEAWLPQRASWRQMLFCIHTALFLFSCLALSLMCFVRLILLRFSYGTSLRVNILTNSGNFRV